jgi:hypothetical protein
LHLVSIILVLSTNRREDSLNLNFLNFLNFFNLYLLIHLFPLFLFSLLTNQWLKFNYFPNVMERIHSPTNRHITVFLKRPLPNTSSKQVSRSQRIQSFCNYTLVYTFHQFWHSSTVMHRMKCVIMVFQLCEMNCIVYSFNKATYKTLNVCGRVGVKS